MGRITRTRDASLGGDKFAHYGFCDGAVHPRDTFAHWPRPGNRYAGFFLSAIVYVLAGVEMLAIERKATQQQVRLSATIK